MAVLTTQQILSFIQYKIAFTHATGGDVLSLLTNPEIVFSLQMLDGNYSYPEQTPENKANERNINTGTEQLLTAVGINTNKGESQTMISSFKF